MLNFGWAELLVIGLVALIVIGPEDLPQMFRQLGRFTAKLRQMSREFSRAMEQAAKDSGVNDVTKDLKNMTSAKSMGLDAVKSAADKFEKWDPIKNAAKPTLPQSGSTLTQAKPLVPPPMPITPPTTKTAEARPDGLADDLADDLAEAEDDLADLDLNLDPEPAPEPKHGPATQALLDKQAARAAVFKEQAAKLKAIDDGTYRPEPTILPPAPPPKPAAKKAASVKVAKAEVAAKPAAKPRKSTKKADQA